MKLVLIRKSTTAAVDAAQSLTHPSPSIGQYRAGNYRKGKVSFHGLTVSIETPAGVARGGWTHKLSYPYGYINRTAGADGDHVDCTIGPHPESQLVFIVDQGNATGGFDEHKVILGCQNEAEARKVYLSNYEPGWPRLGAITAFSMPRFKHWLQTCNLAKPAAATMHEGIIKSVGDKDKVSKSKLKKAYDSAPISAVCSDCGYSNPDWDGDHGSCPDCGGTTTSYSQASGADVNKAVLVLLMTGTR